MRLISDSEIGSAMSCQAQHDFRYVGQLAGSALKPKLTAPILRDGRAWGAAVAAFHANQDRLHPGQFAIEALDESLDEDVKEQVAVGVFTEADYDAVRERLLKLLLHYVHTCDRFEMDEVTEREVNVPIPSRTGRHASSLYRFQGFLDGTREINGRIWIVEFKLRAELARVEAIQLSRQIRRYAWAWWQMTGIKPAGVMVCERLNEVPKPARLVMARAKRKGESEAPKTVSHAKDQMTTAESYIEACGEYEVDPHDDVVEALNQRRWQQNTPILFRDSELEETGRELVSAAHLIGMLDSGKLFPVRNARPQNCRSCSFADICPAPDSQLVDALFKRVPSKRDRNKEAV